MSKKKHIYTFSLCPIESIHTSNGKVYTDEEMKKMVEEYSYFGKLHGNDYLGLGQLYHNRERFVTDLSKISHKIKKLEFSGNKVYGEFETLISPSYEKDDSIYTFGDLLDYSLKNHKPHNVVFVINDDEIKTVDIELEHDNI